MSDIPTGNPTGSADCDDGSCQAVCEPVIAATEPGGTGCDGAHGADDQAPDAAPPIGATGTTEAASWNITGDRNVVGHSNTVISGDGNTTSFA